MVHLKLPVPPGFVITTEACLEYFHHKQSLSPQEQELLGTLPGSGKGDESEKSIGFLPRAFIDEYTRSVHELERQSGRKFGIASGTKPGDEKTFPLLLSVRSGAAVSMPGMMDTVLNLGMNDEIVARMVTFTNNSKFVLDTYRRFLQMFGTVVLGIDKKRYDNALEAIRLSRGVLNDAELSVADLQLVINDFKAIASVPSDPWDQLRMSIVAVFNSWFSPRAVAYRDIHGIRNDLGTAVTVQCMVFGNMNARSGSGVCFTRNPSTGEKAFFGEYLPNAEGEDVVAGIRTPMTFEDMRRDMPEVYAALTSMEVLLERHYRDMQDIEFTVENGHLYILQTRTGKRTPKASVRIAVSLAHEKVITEREALLRIDAHQMDFFLHPTIDPAIASTGLGGLQTLKIGHGLAASAGAAVGTLVFTCADAKEASLRGERVILCREETSADDIIGMEACEGMLTMRGGMTSHAAVVCRALGKPAVTGACAHGMHLTNAASSGSKGHGQGQGDASRAGAADLYSLTCSDGKVLRRGDVITIDGSHGDVFIGEIPTVPAGHDPDYQTLLRWADKYKRMRVLANADTIEEAKKAKELGAEGIGLCRTEHMFFQSDRIDLMRAMILSTKPEDRQRFLNEILPLQRSDFLQMFRMMRNRQVTIRLLDPPLHEFLPHDMLLALRPTTATASGIGAAAATVLGSAGGSIGSSGSNSIAQARTVLQKRPLMPARQTATAKSVSAAEAHTMASAEQSIRELAERMGMDPEACLQRARDLQESNPMLGFRGCRLSIVLPEITEMQVKAIIGAAIAAQIDGFVVRPEIMIPLVCCDHEVACIISLIRDTAATVCAEAGECVDYKVGCMLEVPRACVRAEAISKETGLGFVSIGSNDLTQLTYGFSRDDTASFMPVYMDKGILAADPFVTIDQRGVGLLVNMAVKKVRKANPKAEVGVCGEHGGDPTSVFFFDALGIDYISCSPYRVPTAKIAAAQAHIKAVARRREDQDQRDFWHMVTLAPHMY